MLFSSSERLPRYCPCNASKKMATSFSFTIILVAGISLAPCMGTSMVEVNLSGAVSEMSKVRPNLIPCTAMAPSQVPTNGDCANVVREEKEVVKRMRKRIVFFMILLFERIGRVGESKVRKISFEEVKNRFDGGHNVQVFVTITPRYVNKSPLDFVSVSMKIENLAR